MPSGLKRYQQGKDDHFITFSCHRRNAYLTDPCSRSVVEQIFERTRQRHDFRIYGYVLMPEHVHLLVSEPPRTLLATALKAIKQETAKKLKGNREHFWQPRYSGAHLREAKVGSRAKRDHKRESQSDEPEPALKGQGFSPAIKPFRKMTLTNRGRVFPASKYA